MFNKTSDLNSPIFIVYHIAMMGCWETIVPTQLKLLEITNLIQNCNEIKISVVGPRQNLRTLQLMIRDYQQYNKIKIQYNGGLEQFEFPALKMIKRIATNNPDSRILYFHTKGASYCERKYSKKILENMSQWRKFLEYSVIEKWKECYNYLDNYDTCGPDLSEKNWYWGNFWWARADYINKIDANQTLHTNGNRFTCEENFISMANPLTIEITSSFNHERLNKIYSPLEKDKLKWKHKHQTCIVNIFDFYHMYFDEAYYREEPIYILKFLAKRIAKGQNVEESMQLANVYIRNKTISQKDFNDLIELSKRKK